MKVKNVFWWYVNKKRKKIYKKKRIDFRNVVIYIWFMCDIRYGIWDKYFN